jgi:hypothetical protein
MWMYLGYAALDLANDRAREARDAAARWQLLHQADADAPVVQRQPGFGRHLVAVALLRFSSASHSLGEAACDAATRLDQRTA